MARKKVIITNFARGITSDSRDPDTRLAQMIKGFDAHTYEQKLIPYKSSESGDSAGSTSKKENFCMAESAANTWKLYALGVVSGQVYAEILYKNLTTSASNDMSDATWTNTANNQSGSGAINRNLFVYYKKSTNSGGNTGLVFFARNGSHIAAYDPTGTDAIADTHYAVTYTDIGQGIVHSKDDRLYVPFYNSANGTGGVLMKDGTSAFVTGLTTPKHLKPVAVCEYGNYLAIACQSASRVGNSVVFLWDRNTTVVDVSESIDWGEGNLQILEQIEGILVGISFTGVQQGNLTYLLGRFIFRYYAGGAPVVFRELLSEATADAVNDDLPFIRQKINQSLYFLLTATLNGTKQQGVWRCGRASPGLPLSVTLVSPPNNDTALAASSSSLRGFFLIGDYIFIAYSDGGTYAVSKTNDSSTAYSMTSIYESLVFTGGDSATTKKLVGVSVMHEALPASGSVVIKYKKDSDTSYGTTIMTSDTDNDISKSAVRDSVGAVLPEFKEISFRLEATGAKCVITGLKFVYEELDKEVYSN